ncbi:recombinase family protein [Caulobacter sp. UNC279MFTsu5.1]|uniref:recombinase family protein n=1 Tax=Caulobacter sp. UNC279MFTsu5.1 TaxID=1502775 RepID=UPI003517B991
MARQQLSKPPKSHAALYLRVSTARQADSDLSIPDQRRQLSAYAASKGFSVVTEFVEPGNTATDDKRPGFQAMIEAGLTKPPAFDTILVHSFSRFFRDQFLFEFYTRKLARNGVRLVSITQELGDDPMGLMMRQMMALFDEYQSRENAKHTLRAMKENARQGFWNGSRPPIGYRVVDAEQRGVKVKRKLEIEPESADVIRLMFDLALTGHGASGPMGVKGIVNFLNERQIRTRDGGRWGISAVYSALTRPTYMGEHRFNTRVYKTGELKDEAEHVVMEVPAIIDREKFEAVGLLMNSRNPKAPGGNLNASPILLAGICHCGICGGTMTLRTGKNNAYRYYTCASRARTGPTSCGGLTVRMDIVDAAVVHYLETRLLDPRYLTELMTSVIDRRQAWIDQRHKHVADLRKRATEAQARLNRLYDAIEAGAADASDPDLKGRITELKALRDGVNGDADRAERAINRLGPIVTPELLAQFAEATKRALRNEDGSFRRDTLRAIAQRVEIKSKVEAEVSGCRVELFRSLAAANGSRDAAVAVPSRVPEWRALLDSNQRPLA